jgi:hypothetical protein
VGLRFGAVCERCPGPGRCKDKPTVAEPIEMKCIACGGSAAGCDHCRNGRFAVQQCPLEFVDDEIWDLVRYADLMTKGLTPVSGGLLDQSASFVKAAHFVIEETEYYKAKQGFLWPSGM